VTENKECLFYGQISEWKSINSSVPQGSVLGLLLFLVYINDITEGLESIPLLFADDTALLEIVDCPEELSFTLNNDLEKISNWSQKWLVTMNPSKCEAIVFSAKMVNLSILNCIWMIVPFQKCSHTHI
jgi:hypothetical protein